ncbi:MAG: hypothetical protein EBT04_13770, partial [Betaproteobacteria bacterium]|nr:hypothetical protein [Betaproteobacteria bacterium]
MDGGDVNNTVTISVNTIPLDQIQPTISITSSQSSLSSGQTASVSFAFSEPVADFVFNDITVSGGTLSNFAGSGTSYSATFTPNINSTSNAVISVSSNKFSDTAGNFNTDGADANNTVTLTVDTVAPTVQAFAPNDGAAGIDPAVSMTMAWSEAVQRGVGTIEIRQGSATGPLFESFDIASSNRLSLSGIPIGGGGPTLTIDPVQTLKDLTQYFVVVPAGGLKDLAGNSYAGTSTYDFTTRAAVPVSIAGSSADDSLVGGGANDTLTGGAGNDTLDGGGGIDSLLGGTGNDTYYVDSQSDVVIEGVAEGTDTVIASVSLYLPGNLENLTLTGTAYFGVGNALDNVVTGSSTENLLLGGAGNDTVRGGDARDAIFGEAGNDVLYGDAGIDYIVAGTGNDTIYAGNNADEAYGEDGNDLIYGGDDFDSDILVGGAGNDTIDGGPAWDQMYGGTGDDTFYVSQQVDWVFENAGEGYDTVIADSPNGYYLYANIEALTLVGTTPFGVGNDLSNILTGSAIGNVLLGGAGNDTLDGGAGQDILYGQAGSDMFLIRKGTGIDIIADFTPGTDRIDLSDYGFKSVATARALFQQVGGDVSVNLGNGDTLILVGVQSSSIGNADIYLGSTGSVDTTPPTIGVSSDRSSLTTGQTATLTFNVSESVLDFVVSDITVTGGVLSAFAGSGMTYAATFTPTSNSTVSGVVSVASNKFSDAAGNFNVDGADSNNTVTMTVNTIAPDTTPPTIAISSDKTSLKAGETTGLVF